MDDIGRWNELVFAQRLPVGPQETELMLHLVVPLESDQKLFRVGWDLKRPGKGGFVAISTGRACWERSAPSEGASYMCTLIDECNRLLEPIHPSDRY